jgi:nicotinic acetylcholine receptor, invertebrate
MGIKWFPFDEQLCVIVFGSWSYTSNYLNYTLMVEKPDLQSYTENNEWSLVAYKPFRALVHYENWIEKEQNFTEIRYKILISRKPLFVLQNMVVPAHMLCVLTLVSFFIPFAQSMQIGISIMLAFSVFKLRLSDDVPVQSDSVPLINIYFTVCMSFSLAAMIWFSLRNYLTVLFVFLFFK